MHQGSTVAKLTLETNCVLSILSYLRSVLTNKYTYAQCLQTNKLSSHKVFPLPLVFSAHQQQTCITVCWSKTLWGINLISSTIIPLNFRSSNWIPLSYQCFPTADDKPSCISSLRQVNVRSLSYVLCPSPHDQHVCKKGTNLSPNWKSRQPQILLNRVTNH